ncbi:MaoC family dehydratase [Desulfatibacillum aliphaticivorans]|uniref:MaoC family dehydratase n=1 Tax=Desulfatibacillum aliphaticivorans TaxID=218208 RepID=UPI000428CF53|nr:MaoC family dehydratase N-terminal domain-containing protein [Desulfatibacillum aliphaticivorans]
MTAEKLPDRFEKDFFKHESQQRSWDDLVVGETYDAEPFEVTPERIQLYVEGTEDFNPFFTDEEAAKNSQFEGLIAPPTILTPIVFAAVSPDSWIKMPGAINPGQRWEFGVPVRPGDTIYCHIKLRDKYIKRGKKYAMSEMHITNQNDEFVCRWTGGLVLQFQGNEEMKNR